MPDRRSARYRYGPWRSGPDPLAPPFDVRAAVDELGRDVLAGGSLRDALRDLLRRGSATNAGLDDLLEQVRRRRADLQRSGRLAGTLERVRELLDEALSAERAALSADPSEDARFREARLEAVPTDPARAVTDLESYDWRSNAARRAYQEIRRMLQQDVLDQQFRGVREALQGDDPEAAQRLRDMLAGLNALLSAHARGEDTADRFREFMDRHAEFFPEQPKDVDELIDLLAQRAAAAERFMRSLTPEQRDELARLVHDALQDLDLASELSQLRDNLRALRPGLDWSSRADVDGAEPLSYGQGTGIIAELADLDALVEQLAQQHPGATLDDVDVDALERQLGPAAVRDLHALRSLQRELERQGWLTRDRDGLHLTPKALRRLGQTALRRVFAQLNARGQGDHEMPDAGAAGDPTGAWREWRFGDEQPIDVVRTVQHAVLRTAGNRHGHSVALDVDDFAIVETEQRATAAVALCVDLSFSMVQEGRWGPMKQTAIALHHLMSTRFRQDALEIIGFNRWAARLSAPALAGIEPDWIQGTNLHHALLLAGRFLHRHPDAEPVVLVVTDGEPTAHLEDDGEAFFDWPPHPATIRRTIAEIDALTRYGATINVFMLGEDSGLQRFVDAVARRNGGRVFTPSTDRLGEYVVSDYLRARRGRRRKAS